MEQKLLLALTAAALLANVNNSSYSVVPGPNGFSVKPHSTHDGECLRISSSGNIFAQEKLLGNIKDFRQGCKHVG